MKKNYTRLPLDQPHPSFKHETVMWHPLLNVRVGWNHRQTPRFPAVVDSGSPYCLFRLDVGTFLGMDVTKGAEVPVSGIMQGMTEPAHFHKVKIYVESDWIIDVTVGFVKKLSVAGILGRNGFFDNFQVRFDQSATPPLLEITRIERVQ